MPIRTAIQFPHHVLTRAQIDLLGVKAYEGGFQNVALTDPGKGKSYTLSRPPAAPRRAGVATTAGPECSDQVTSGYPVSAKRSPA